MVLSQFSRKRIFFCFVESILPLVTWTADIYFSCYDGGLALDCLHDNIFLNAPGCASLVRAASVFIIIGTEYRNVMLRASCIVSSLKWTLKSKVHWTFRWYVVEETACTKLKVSIVVKFIEFSALSDEFLGNNAKQQSLWDYRFGMYHTFRPFSKFCSLLFELQLK